MLPVAILAGGLATRMLPHTERIPKALLDIGGRPFAEHQVALLARHGVTHIVFCVGHLGDEIQRVLGEGSRWGVRLTYVSDGPRLRGTGGALQGALPHLGTAFFVLYGDSYLDCDYGAVERAYRDAGRLGLMTVFRNDGQWDASNVHFDGVRIRRYSKRDRVPEMRHIDYGLGVLDARALDPYNDDRHLDLATVYEDLLGRGELAGFEVNRRFYEIGSPAGLEELRRHLAGGDVP
jgi:N-acetyl-alpha-D-muramate 1-phosphate uridylyltransferase